MRELRIQRQGSYRALYVFDPRRTAILLLWEQEGVPRRIPGGRRLEIRIWRAPRPVVRRVRLRTFLQQASTAPNAVRPRGWVPRGARETGPARNRWYDTVVPQVDDLYYAVIEELRKEGLI